jgi:hypothetical protein
MRSLQRDPILSAIHRPDGSEASATIMRCGFMAATLEPSGFHTVRCSAGIKERVSDAWGLWPLHPARHKAGRVFLVHDHLNVVGGALACRCAPAGLPTRNAWNGTAAPAATSGSTDLPAATILPARRAST